MGHARCRLPSRTQAVMRCRGGRRPSEREGASRARTPEFRQLRVGRSHLLRTTTRAVAIRSKQHSDSRAAVVRSNSLQSSWCAPTDLARVERDDDWADERLRLPRPAVQTTTLVASSRTTVRQARAWWKSRGDHDGQRRPGSESRQDHPRPAPPDTLIWSRPRSSPEATGAADFRRTDEPDLACDGSSTE